VGTLLDLRGTIPPAELNAVKLNDVPFCITYVFPAKDFDADWTEIIESPAGFRGRVRSIMIYDVTETFNSVTTEASILVGISGDTNAFVTSADLGDLAATASDSPTLTDGVTLIIPIGTTIHVTGVAPTGGSPDTGIATIAVTIQYFK